MPLVFVFILCTYCSLFTEVEPTGKLLLNIENVSVDKGFIWVGIYKSEQTFMIKEKALVIKASPSNSRIEIPKLAYGYYAIALFHDINGNGALDFNLMGIPSEPFGFSKPPPSNWRLPKFKEIAVDFNSNGQSLKISLSNWKPF